MTLRERIVKIAKSYIGQREKPNNTGWVDSDFQEKMMATGWQMSQAWCAYFAELVWKEAVEERTPVWYEFDRLFSAGAVATFTNFKKSDYLTDMTPSEGCLVIWQTHKDGKPSWTGHVGIIVEVLEDGLFKAVEGNTNMSGGREGIEVGLMTRNLNATSQSNGLRLIGFVHPQKAIV